MSQDILYVGIDVGSQQLWASCAGRRPKAFPHTPKGIRALYAWSHKQKPSSPLHFCMEATGVYSLSLAMRLRDQPQVQVSIVNPARIAAYARMQMKRSKTDQVDAEVIRAYAAAQHPAPWTPPPAAWQHLTALVAQADAVSADLRQWRNRHHTQQFLPDLPEAVTASQQEIERALTEQRQQLETAIAQLCAQDARLAQQVALLATIPGVGTHTAIRLLAYGQHWLTQTSAKALTAHAGLAPHHYQSGSSVHGKSRIDKRGNAKLRTTLYMPALVAVHHNPLFIRFYQRLLANGKPKKLALVAAMRKLLLISRAILINQQPFNPNMNPLT